MRLCEIMETKLCAKPLGRWLHAADQLRRKWPQYASSTLYVRSDGFLLYKSRDCEYFSEGQPCDWQPNATSAPVGVIPEQLDRYTIRIPIHPYISESPPAIPPDFVEYLQTLPSSDRHLFQSMELLVPVTTLIEVLDETARGTSSNTTCQGVSDGTEVHSSMAFAWVLSDPQGRRLAQCAGPAFGSQACSLDKSNSANSASTNFLPHQLCPDGILRPPVLVLNATRQTKPLHRSRSGRVTQSTPA
jgi:hypothetical protein